MGTNSTDYVCDLNCPVKKEVPICCQNCKESRKGYVTDSNKHLWTNGKGFWSKTGCKLSRKDMPLECKTYDCRRHDFTIIRYWVNGDWIDTHVSENHS